MEIINRDVEFGNICQRVNTGNNICNLNAAEEKRINSTFEKLRNSGKEVSSIEELKEASEMVRKEELAKMRVLKKEENSGFILVSSLTCIGTLVVGTIIFMTIKLLIIG